MGETILVAGGAGYIGSHTCLRLAEAGFMQDNGLMQETHSLTYSE